MKQSAGTVRGVYEAFAVGDIPAVLGMLADDMQRAEAEGGPRKNTGQRGLLSDAA